MTPGDLQRIISLSGIPYLTGYRQLGAITPYLLVQALPVVIGDPHNSMAELQKAAPGAFFDDRRKCAVMHPPLPATSGLEGTSYCFVGKTETIAIHCYQLTADRSSYTPTFEATADSFRFDPGYDFASRGLAQSSPFFGGAEEGALRGAIIGVLVGVILTFFRSRGKRW